ncbi:DUF6507 family protein [Homoserinimonas sp. OAct 916]|uniref:DUF6507 family protein n=1 Tax=Homoserinimonas sp. OAct 916 TaxID=2211450 RepID=UPI000DBE807C|nr:DUF6507 family protein [Homoserinimonas sp. OAct 916]
MAGWKIQPQGVLDVLTSVNTKAEAMGAALEPLSDAMTAAVTATNSPAIGDAVQGYFSEVASPQLEGVSARISASITGASGATEAYVQGDLEMAATAQREQIILVSPNEFNQYPMMPR